jgi:hypothetical protein
MIRARLRSDDAFSESSMRGESPRNRVSASPALLTSGRRRMPDLTSATSSVFGSETLRHDHGSFQIERLRKKNAPDLC